MVLVLSSMLCIDCISCSFLPLFLSCFICAIYFPLYILNRENATPNKVKEAHRRVMVANHPDAGGSHYLASKINEAKDVMLGKTKGSGSAFWFSWTPLTVSIADPLCHGWWMMMTLKSNYGNREFLTRWNLSSNHVLYRQKLWWN